MITEAGGPHRCPSPTLQTGVFKTLGFSASSYFDVQKVIGMKVITTSSKKPSRQWVFSEPAKILEPISGGAEHRMGPRDPRSLLQDSHPLGIIDLQRFCFNLKRSRLIRKDPDDGEDCRQEEKGVTEDEIVRWHH